MNREEAQEEGEKWMMGPEPEEAEREYGWGSLNKTPHSLRLGKMVSIVNGARSCLTSPKTVKISQINYITK